MESITVVGIVIGAMALKGVALFALVYVASRLAIRHERRAAS